MSEIMVADEKTARSGARERERARSADIDPARRSAAETRAQAAQKLAEIGEMTQGIAHDLRNVLAVIEAGLRLAANSAEQPEQVRAYLAAAHEGVERGVNLISRLLAFSKQQQRGARAVDVNALLGELEPFLRYGAGPGVRVLFEPASGLPRCLIDPAQFEAAVLNLVVNARDAMPAGGAVRISTQRWLVSASGGGSAPPGLYVRVRVADNGQGMSDDTLRKVFDPFFTTKGEKGTGLGLPQVYAFMRLIGGHVNIVSGRGTGTSVDLLFPSVEPERMASLPRGKAR
jgi:signal transduction histidine kinase